MYYGQCLTFYAASTDNLLIILTGNCLFININVIGILLNLEWKGWLNFIRR